MFRAHTYIGMTDEENAVFDGALALLPDFAHLAVALLQQEAGPLEAVRFVALQLVQVVASVHRAHLQQRQCVTATLDCVSVTAVSTSSKHCQ